ncbi:T9SS type A sorting domain-containing protein [Bacteroidales bacterium OttesenSCG-928-L03]|nr:T9SS type A sorting domain-containing protein [Bacteroidales bacterium OttesenSCG-928-L03]
MKTKLQTGKRLAVVLVALFCIGSSWIQAQEEPGKVGHLYLIEKAEHLVWVSDRTFNPVVERPFEGDTLLLMNDIDMGALTDWRPIGSRSYPFWGNVDGQGYAVKNLTVSQYSTANNFTGGLFGYVQGSNSFRPSIRNLGIENFNLSFSIGQYKYGGYDYWPANLRFAILVGEVYYGGDISNCYVSDSRLTVSDGPNQSSTGGLVGTYSGSEIRHCFVRNCRVSNFAQGSTSTLYYRGNQAYVAGLAGSLITAVDCYVEDTNVQSNRSHTGGIAGTFSQQMSNCFMTGNVTVEGEVYVANCANTTSGQSVHLGGIVAGTDPALMKNCYMTGKVSFQGTIPHVYKINNDKELEQLLLPTYIRIGGLAGTTRYGMKNCYNTGELYFAGNGYDLRFEVGGLVGQGGTRLYSPSIFNSVFAGKINNPGISNAAVGTVIGRYYSEYENSDARISHVYYTSSGLPPVGATNNTYESLADCRYIAPAEVLKAGFYLDETNWEYSVDKTSNYWSLRPYVYQDGQMPLLRRVVEKYTDPVWDGRSYLMCSVRNGLQINNPAQLAWLAGEVNLGQTFEGITIELGHDLDMGGHYWPVIGNNAGYTSSSTSIFNGIFNGNGHTIRNFELYEYEPRGYGGAAHTAGLFGKLGRAELNNIRVDEVRVKLEGMYFNNGLGTYYVGGLAGQSTDSLVTIRDCHVTNLEVTSGEGQKMNTFYLGGLVGTVDYGGVIEHCSAKMKADVLVDEGNQVSAVGGLIGRVWSTLAKRIELNNLSASPWMESDSRYLGGLIGYATLNTAEHLLIEACSVTEGSIRSTHNLSTVGGLIGYAVLPGARIHRSYSTIHTEGVNTVGGFIGTASSNKILHVAECFATGKVMAGIGRKKVGSANHNAGGFIGSNNGVVTQNCYAIGDVSSLNQTGTYDVLGGFESSSGSPLTRQNCYSTGRITALASEASTKTLGAFGGRCLTNVINCFSDSEVVTEDITKFYFNGLFGEQHGSDVYKPIHSYIPYAGKRFGTETEAANFKSPDFFTSPANWCDTTVLAGTPKIGFSTREWDTSVWLLEDGYYPKLRNLNQKSQINPKDVNAMNIVVSPGGLSALISWEKWPGATSYVIKVYADPAFSVPVAELEYDENGVRIRTDESLISVQLKELEQETTYYYNLSAYTDNLLLIAEYESLFRTTDRVSIGELDKESRIWFPNPNNGRFVINKPTNSSCRVSIVNLQGMEVFSTGQTGHEIQVDIADCPAGIYLLKLMGDGAEQTSKIIKR